MIQRANGMKQTSLILIPLLETQITTLVEKLRKFSLVSSDACVPET